MLLCVICILIRLFFYDTLGKIGIYMLYNMLILLTDITVMSVQ